MVLYSEGHEHKVSFGLTPFSEWWLAKLGGRVCVVVGSPCCVFSEAGAACILTDAGGVVSMHAATASENTQHGEPTTTPTLPSSFASHHSENGVNPNETLYSCPSEYNTI